MGKLDEQLLQDGEPADARVEHGDRTVARLRGASGHRGHDSRWTPRYRATVRALVVSNMAASRERPGRGVFVRDQVAALRAPRRRRGRAVRVRPRARSRTRVAARALRRRYGGAALDVVHAHFGLTAWPALALRGPPPRGHPARHRRAPSALAPPDARRAARAWTSSPPSSEALADGARRAAGRRRAVLPCGVALDRFRPIPRDAARMALGHRPRDAPCLLFPADPARAVKRFDRALEVAGGVRLITLGATAPDHVTLAINAANAVLVPSDAEGFGLAVLEALACDVPVLATPVGVHAQALDGPRADALRALRSRSLAGRARAAARRARPAGRRRPRARSRLLERGRWRGASSTRGGRCSIADVRRLSRVESCAAGR